MEDDKEETKSIKELGACERLDTLKQYWCFRLYKYKDCQLVYILTEMSGSTSTIFTRYCGTALSLAFVLRILGFRAIPISGRMSESKRLGALNKFKSGECNILVCSDVSTRGLEIPSVDMVINYNIPPNLEDYTQRVGMTGRAGIAISLVDQFELVLYLRIKKLIGKEFPHYLAPEEQVLMLLERVTEAATISDMKMLDLRSRIIRNGGNDGDDEEFDICLTEGLEVIQEREANVMQSEIHPRL